MFVKIKDEYIFETLKLDNDWEINRMGFIRRKVDGFIPSITKVYDKNSKTNRPVVCTINLNGKTMKYHRLIAIQFIPNPENMSQVDHINRNPFDNRIENLRWVDARTNSNNKTNHSPNHNINWHSTNKCWEIKIFVGKLRHFGSFKTTEYDLAIKRRNQLLYFYGFPIPD